MPYKQRIVQLQTMHKHINEEIDKMEKNHPHVHETKIQEMKKLRLQYKDEISRLNRLQWEEDHERVHFDDEQ